MLWSVRCKLESCTNVHFLEYMCGSIPPHLFFHRDFSFFLLRILAISQRKLFHGEWGTHPHQELITLCLLWVLFPTRASAKPGTIAIRKGSTNWNWSYTAPTEQPSVEGCPSAESTKAATAPTCNSLISPLQTSQLFHCQLSISRYIHELPQLKQSTKQAEFLLQYTVIAKSFIPGVFFSIIGLLNKSVPCLPCCNPCILELSVQQTRMILNVLYRPWLVFTVS